MTRIKITQEQLDAALASGCKIFRNLDLSDLDLSTQHLNDLGLSRRYLLDCDFHASNLKGTNFNFIEIRLNAWTRP